MSHTAQELDGSGGMQSTDTVEISTMTGSSVDASLRFVSATSMTVALNQQDHGRFIAGDEATVSARWGSQVGVEIASTTMLGNIQVCQLNVLRHLAGPPLVQAQERRATTRVNPPANTSAVLVTVDDTDHSVSIGRTTSGRLLDLSLGGCAVELTRADVNQLKSVSSVRISFELGRGERVELVAELVNTRLNDQNRLILGYRWLTNPLTASATAAITGYTGSPN